MLSREAIFVKNWKGSALGPVLAGAAAGAVNGLFGLLTLCTDLEEDEVFPASVSVILPVCLVSLGAMALGGPLPWGEALPYLIGSAAGGVLVGLFGRKIPTVWLHRGLGLLILWGGVRYLC